MEAKMKLPEILYEINHSLYQISRKAVYKQDNEVVLFVWFIPYLYPIREAEIGPYPIFLKKDGTFHFGDVKPLNPESEIVLKRDWARAARMRYEELPLVRLGGDTDVSDKTFRKE